MAGTVSKQVSASNVDQASENFAHLMARVAGLYCAGGSSSMSACEMHEHATVRVCLTGTRVLKEHQKALRSHVRSAWRIAQFCRGPIPTQSELRG